MKICADSFGMVLWFFSSQLPANDNDEMDKFEFTHNAWMKFHGQEWEQFLEEGESYEQIKSR